MFMSKIAKVSAREILDSRGNPTLEARIETENGHCGVACVPSGASTGEHEALEMRDGDPSRYHGKGVLHAVNNVNGPLAEILVGKDCLDQRALDQTMIDADGTENKSQFGANAILGCSLALARVRAKTRKLPLYKSIVDQADLSLPIPMLNIINGGVHADNTLDFQEFMIRPINAPNFRESVRIASEIFHTLQKLLQSEGHNVSVGDEGGFAPNLKTHEEALDFILRAVEKAGYKPKEQITIALDCAASFMFDRRQGVYSDKKAQLAGEKHALRTPAEQVEYLEALTKKYPIDSIEDGLDENDWEGWKILTESLGSKVQLVGDDLFVTSPKFLQKGIDMGVANAILIKLNQIGTLTETLDTIALAKQHQYDTVISHRSGETEDTFIADLAVATGAGQIKTGSVSRSERVAKYNRLMLIEEEIS